VSRSTGRVSVKPTWYFSGMTATIDGAGRVVIPKALRERAGLTPGTKIDFVFMNGNIEIHPVVEEGEWETRHGINFPVPPAGAPELSASEVRSLIEAVREERAEQVARAGS